MHAARRILISGFAFLWLSCLVSLPALAAEAAGKVLYAYGEVSARDAGGTTRILKRGSPIYAGDMLATGRRGRAQLRFSDGGFISLQPSTRFRIDQFAYAGRPDGSERGFFSLLRGGLRAITGAIGRKHRKAYRVKTPVATIGIRGTSFEAVLKGGGESVSDAVIGRPDDGFLKASTAMLPGAQLAGAGGLTLFVKCGDGAISLTNELGRLFLNAGQKGFVRQGEAPRQQREMPVISSFDGARETLDEVTETGDVQQGERNVATDIGAASGGPAPDGAAAFWAFGHDLTNQIFSESGSLVANAAQGNEIIVGSPVSAFTQQGAPGDFPCEIGACFFKSAGATLADSGQNPAHGVSWARWEGAWEFVAEDFIGSVPNGQLVPVDSFHVLFTDNLTPVSAFPGTGTIVYSNPAGGSGITNENSVVGSIDSFIVQVDFLGKSMNSSLAATFPSGSLNMAGSGSFDPSMPGGRGVLFMSGTCAAGLCPANPNLFGGLHTGFVGQNGPDALVGAFHVQNSGAPVVHIFKGTVVLEP